MRRRAVLYPVVVVLFVCLAAVAAACGGSDKGGSQPPPQPTATTGEAPDVGETEAQVEGTANARNGQGVTYYFEYGEDTSYGSTTPPQPLQGDTDQQVNATIENLDPDTEYHYQLVVRTGSGTIVKGGDQTFTTAAEGEGDQGGSDDQGGGNQGGTTGQSSTGGRTTGRTTGQSTQGYTTVRPSTGGYTTVQPTTGGYTTVQPTTGGGDGGN